MEEPKATDSADEDSKEPQGSLWHVVKALPVPDYTLRIHVLDEAWWIPLEVLQPPKLGTHLIPLRVLQPPKLGTHPIPLRVLQPPKLGTHLIPLEVLQPPKLRIDQDGALGRVEV